MLQLGTYVGDGLTPRSVLGVGFQPDVVFVAGTGLVQATSWNYRLSAWPAASGARLAGGLFETEIVRDFLADGFTVGLDGSVNANLQDYAYVAIRLPHAGIDIGAFTGDGVDDRVIPVPFQPMMAVMGQRNFAGQFNIWRTDVVPLARHAHRLSGNDVEVNSIKELVAAGIRLGINAQVNGAGNLYDYLAFGAVASATQLYTGDGTANRVLPALAVGANPVRWVIISGAMNPPPGALQFGRGRSLSFPLNRSVQIVAGAPATDGQIEDFPGANSVEISNVNDPNAQNYNTLAQEYQLFALASTLSGAAAAGRSSKIPRLRH